LTAEATLIYIYSFEKDASKIEASKQEAQKRFDDDLKAARKRAGKSRINTTGSLPGQPKHFTCQFTAEQINKLYADLISSGYLPKDNFDFMFGIKAYPQDFKPLHWKKIAGVTCVLCRYAFFKVR
jgi:hypothetical protein